MLPTPKGIEGNKDTQYMCCKYADLELPEMCAPLVFCIDYNNVFVYYHPPP